jgi:hypothetical protein
MTVRMPETDRVIGALRVAVLILGVTSDGAIRCTYCDAQVKSPVIDHVKPRAIGGPVRQLPNLVVACPACNAAKGNKTVIDAFGPNTAVKVAMHLMNRELGEYDWLVATLIARLTRNTSKMVQHVLDYVFYGVIPTGDKANG